jgi:pyruvate/2-oxoglutarate dehydrogenase complex dihydrolipoamide dehydrogenase (E3) component
MVHVVVVGAYGSAGSAAAERLAAAPDVELTLVDDGDPGGGLCILRGCMPSKELLSAGAHRYRARTDGRLDGPVPDVDAGATVARKDGHTGEWAAHRRERVDALAERHDVEFLHETARFVDATTVAAGDRTLDADYVVLATGSSPNVPDLPGLDEVDWQGSADVLEATTFPDSAVVMGFGYVGLELAPYLAEVGGVDVTVVEHDDAPLDEADPGYGAELVDLYEREFPVDVLTNARERRVEPTDDGGVRLHVEHDDGREERVEAGGLYLFTGREPTLSGLGLSNTPLDPGPGWVEDTQRARDHDRVFVAGDVTGDRQVLHVAKEEGYTAADNVLADARGEALAAYDPTVHRVVFTALGEVPYARVGHTAASAADLDRETVTVTRAAADDGVFRAKDTPEGLGTLVVDAEDGTVLGWQGLHLHADAMAKTMQVVVEAGMDVRDVPDRAYHPTTPEILDGLVRDARAEL